MQSTWRRSLLICAVVLASAGMASAELIQLEMTHYPRVYCIGVHVLYEPDPDAGPYGLLTVTGDPWDIYTSPAPVGDEVYGAFTLTAQIDPTTDQAVGGTLTMTGDVEPFDLFSSSQLIEFGFGGNDLFQFKFIQNGATGLAPQGHIVGVILEADSIPDAIFGNNPPTVPTFETRFENNWNGIANVFYLPEPGTLAVLTVGGLMLRRRRQQRAA